MSQKYLFPAAALLILVALVFACVRPKGGEAENDATLDRPAVPPVGVMVPAASGLNLKALPATIDYAQLSKLMASSPSGSFTIIDVRTAEEYAAGFIPGAILKPYDAMPGNVAELPKDTPIVLYCRSGRRSAIAKSTLVAAGFTNVADFGGIDRWQGQLSRP